ncbi:phenylacetic acid degradation bifunctional protein PaaZ [Jatrophihabitans sp. YIM 134969]
MSDRYFTSYVQGSWQAPTPASPESGTAVHDAVTGELIGRVSTEGIDLGAALAHAREVGGPALRQLSLANRAALLKAMGSYLREHRDELYALSARSGATRYDSRFDVDGGIGVLLTYASKGKRELAPEGVLVDGPVEPLGKGGTFVARHVWLPLQGAAVQINAFNFPVWGPLEKFAPAFLAGMPSVVKPAEQTAYVTHRLVELMIESNLLPEGSLQLLTGGPGDLLDHLTEQDVLGFTGSASTAAKIRTHPNVVAHAVRVTAEADSLNCSILGPDAVPGTPEFDLYVDGVVTEMTVKAGQKCTAIRRAFVPEPLVDDVARAVAAELTAVTVGAPGADGVRMGALASLEQREEFRRSLKALTSVASVVFGDPEHVEVVGADAATGAFVSPVLLRATDPIRAELHEVEAFGPACTLIPYTDVASVVDLARRGRGSLAGSVVSHDPDFVREVVLGIAPWHGRLLVLDRDDAGESTGHGSPLPLLVHGGPGRAGGGEELGGVRGVLHHMQRTAVQGSPAVLAAITGQWVAGAPRGDDSVHPFRKSLAELRIGDTVTAGPRTVTEDDVAHFAGFTGDTFYAHTDADAAAANPFFDGKVAHGYLVLSFAAGLFVDPDPGPVLANYGLDNLRFLTPTYPGDDLTVTLTCKEISPRAGDYGEVRWDTDVVNGKGESVAKYDVLTMVAKQWPPATEGSGA